jgi:hypothetical protein
MHGISSIFSYLLRLALCPKYDQFWRKFHGLLRRMYIVWMLDEILCRHQLGPFDLWCDFILEFLFIDFFCLDELSIGDRWVLKSSNTTVLESIYAFRSFRLCLMKLGALMLGACRLIIVISFLCISPPISMECLSLSH